ncbi:maleylpyruvate isomerase family mycothiol-dependent enzyme [Amycolatopsis sp. NPDC021455]|uniref:maleylpyruvate isomerase family mycothiol-dependent enzyme n=1 Tax=Amycolatopsis sp. NPDC021455 TaxID=3154901 RepID=UPI0033CA258B
MTHPEPATRRHSATWSLIHAERAALAGDLAGLTDRQWATPSLCAGLTVREVLAHLTAGASLGPARWMAGVIRCRFDFDRQVAMRLAEQLGATPAGTLARFRRVSTGTTKPPLPAVAMLGEAIVHGEDIRRPLGLHRDYPITTLTRVAGYYHGSDLVVLAKGRVRGLRLAATDGPFGAGSGPLVSGTTLALIMAMTGRTLYCDELDGDGAAILRDHGTSRPDAKTRAAKAIRGSDRGNDSDVDRTRVLRRPGTHSRWARRR